MPCDSATLLASAQCFFACGDRALEDALEIVLLCAIRDGDTELACDPSALVAEAQCLLHCIPQGASGAATRRSHFNDIKSKLHSFSRFSPCFVCGIGATARHHIVQLKNGGINSKKNIVSLCHQCHSTIHPWLKEG
jgi:hypothetical protein